MQNIPDRPHRNVFNMPARKSNLMLVDNGTFELRAGYPEEMVMSVRNRTYKNKGRVSFDPFPLATMKTMFEGDVIINMDILEYSMDMILGHTKPNSLDKLILTACPEMPTVADVLELLFSAYKFNEIQVGTDYIYSYQKYFDGKDCLIIALKYSAIYISYVYNGKVTENYKLNFGGCALMEYINYIMVDRYKEFRKDYRNLIYCTRVSDNYEKESCEIYQHMCAGDYSKTLFISEAQENKVERVPKKNKRVTSQSLHALPTINYDLLFTEDKELTKEQIKEKRKYKMLYYGALHRIKTRIDKSLLAFSDLIDNLEDDLEKQNNIELYIERKKAKFEKIKRELELRDKLRRDSKNRKTREFQVKNKEGVLSPEEQKLRDSIADAEDDIQEDALYERMNELARIILENDPDFIPYYANTVEILRGDNIGRQCVNVELVKWPEIFFNPSIIGSEQMGLEEILEELSKKYSVSNVLICGGFSFIENLEKRVSDIIYMHGSGERPHIVVSENPQTDLFYHKDFSRLFPVYTREDFERYGAEELINRMKGQ